MAEIARPPLQQIAATTPVFRGPTRSSQPPHVAADEPRNTKNRMYIHPRSLILQSQVVVNSARATLMFEGQATDCWTPIARDRGSQNTLKP
jgi:hypothetical protein